MQILSRIFTAWANGLCNTENLKNTLFKSNHPKINNQLNLSKERSIYTNKKVIYEIQDKSLS